MAKTKSLQPLHYELLYIVSNKYTEDELKPIIAKVSKIINDDGGNITYSEEWGKKHLAYPIKHFHYGYYNLVEFDIEKKDINKVNQALRLFNKILRFQIIAKKIRTLEEMAQDQKIAEKIAAKEERVAKEKVKKEKRVDLKDLDKKIDKILETDELL